MLRPPASFVPKRCLNISAEAAIIPAAPDAPWLEGWLAIREVSYDYSPIGGTGTDVRSDSAELAYQLVSNRSFSSEGDPTSAARLRDARTEPPPAHRGRTERGRTRLNRTTP